MSEVIDFSTKATEEQKKVTLVDENGKAANLGIGNLYDVNKNLMKAEPTLSKSKIREGIAKIAADLPHNNYYMLLCRELNNYTIFIYNDDVDEFKAAMRDCIINRGDCKGIEKQADGAWEIWIDTNDDIYAYYLFNCNNCMIQC